MNLNDDGSGDIYFGKLPPKGLELNGIPNAGEDAFLLRFYRPEQSYFDPSFMLSDVEKSNSDLKYNAHYLCDKCKR